MLAPLGYKVLIKPDEVSEETGGKILRPASNRDRTQKSASTGTLLMKGPSVGHGVEHIPDGVRVVFVKYSGAEAVETEDIPRYQDGYRDMPIYLFVNDEDVSGWYGPDEEEQ